MNEVYKLKRNWAIVDREPDYHRQAKAHLIWIFRLIDTGWITPAIKPDIMRALEKLEKVDIDAEVNYNVD